MFKKTKAKSVKEYLANVPDDRKAAVLFLHAFIQKAAPKLKSYFAYNMIRSQAYYFAYNMLGYGSFLYKNYKNEMISWPIIAMASQKNYISVYVCALTDGKYIAEKYQKELGKVSVGRSCIRFRKLADVKLPVLKKVIRLAAQNPGLASA